MKSFNDVFDFLDRHDASSELYAAVEDASATILKLRKVVTDLLLTAELNVDELALETAALCEGARLLLPVETPEEGICPDAIVGAQVAVQDDAPADEKANVAEAPVRPTNPDHRKHAVAECANCGARWDADDLNDISDFWGRVLPGDTMPAGECCDCGSLCYPLG